MNYSKLIAFCWLFIMTDSVCLAQEQTAGCKQMVLVAVKKMSELTQPKKGIFFHYKIHTKVIYRQDLETPPTQLTSNIIIGSELAINQSNLFSLYVDHEDQFLVVHPQKLVHWSKPAPNFNKDSLFKVTSAFQDSLISSATEKECNRSKERGKDLLSVGFEPHPKIKAAFGIKFLRVDLDLDKGRVYRVANFIEGSEEVVKQVYTYEVVNHHFKGKFPTSARDYVFKSKNQFVSQLKGYQLIDLRNGTEMEVQ